MELEKIIYILKKSTYSENSFEKNSNDELKEQDSAGTGSGVAAPYPTVTKWETGLNRSVANQIDYKVKWKDLYKITRGKSNTLL